MTNYMTTKEAAQDLGSVALDRSAMGKKRTPSVDPCGTKHHSNSLH